MHKRGWLVTAGLLAAGVGWCGAAFALPQGDQASAKPKAASGTQTHEVASAYDRALLRPALLTHAAPATYKVRFTTTKGDFVVTVTRSWAPLGADRFYNLVRHHFYDHTSFFRVLRGFVVQWGISAYPPVSAAWSRAPIKDDPVIQSNLRGYITYAKSAEPDTRTTQVFINLVDNKQLDTMGGFAPFGQVTEGMEVVDALYSGYGEGAPQGKGPEQDKIERLGKAYLDQDFSQLDSIKTATLILPETASPRQKPAASGSAKPVH